jgi:nitrite reductase/ring-hydroxylating ferredoxin subunit
MLDFLSFNVAARDVSALVQRRILHVKRLGVPFIVSLDSGDVVRAFVDICPHAWRPRRKAFLREDCILCPLHGASFDVKTGVVVDDKGKRIRAPLKAVTTTVVDGQVWLRIGLSEAAFMAGATAKRALRAAAHFRKREPAKSGRA